MVSGNTGKLSIRKITVKDPEQTKRRQKIGLSIWKRKGKKMQTDLAIQFISSQYVKVLTSLSYDNNVIRNWKRIK